MTSADVRTPRRIGPVGTAGRIALGLVFLVGAFVVAPLGWTDVLVGLVVYPAVTVLALRSRGRDAPPLRLHGLTGHAANIAIAIVLAVINRQAALLFYGSAMLLAAAYGYAGCELFAVANRLSGRDDEIGCPVFSPLDAAEERRSAVDSREERTSPLGGGSEGRATRRPSDERSPR